jgi:hypothetical protein
MLTIAGDILAVGHMLSFAVGIGTAVFLETMIMPQFLTRIDRQNLRILHKAHNLIGASLAALWISGAAILLLKLFWMDGSVTPKLAAKFAVVTLLTVNMKLIGSLVVPALEALEGRSIARLSDSQLKTFGAIGGMSAAGWLCALALGGISYFKPLPWHELVWFFLPALTLGPLLGSFAGLHLGRRSGRFPAE